MFTSLPSNTLKADIYPSCSVPRRSGTYSYTRGKARRCPFRGNPRRQVYPACVCRADPPSAWAGDFFCFVFQNHANPEGGIKENSVAAVDTAWWDGSYRFSTFFFTLGLDRVVRAEPYLCMALPSTRRGRNRWMRWGSLESTSGRSCVCFLCPSSLHLLSGLVIIRLQFKIRFFVYSNEDLVEEIFRVQLQFPITLGGEAFESNAPRTGRTACPPGTQGTLWSLGNRLTWRRLTLSSGS